MNYAKAGKVSRGFWTRLYARAIYLRDAQGNAIVLVSCDLPHIPNGLGDRVAELVSSKPEIAHLSRGQIVLAATHTHHGPENFFSDPFYNSFPSALPGYDPQLFGFLAERITRSISEAADTLHRKPVAEVRYRKAQLPGFFRNRSLDAFVRNPEAKQILAANSAIPNDCVLPEGQTDGNACRAVRAWVEVVEFVGNANATITSMVFLAAHPTVMDPETEVFTGDLFEASSTLLEQGRLGACDTYASPVVAFFNGAQGDASVTWTRKRRDRFELLNADPAAGRLGLAVQLARWICGADAGIAESSHKDPATSPEVGFNFDWLSLRSRDADTGASCGRWHERCTTEEPLPGAAAMGGAEDGRTLWYELGLTEGLRSPTRGPHGRKAVDLELAGSRIQVSKLAATGAPDEVPLGVYRIGFLVIATLPGEFTNAMGERVRAAIAAVAGTSSKHVLLIGLAGGHVSYVTTPEEYDAQHYEGASNLYGPATGPLIQSKLVQLAQAAGSSAAYRKDYDYDPGACRVFLPSHAGHPSFLADDGLQRILLEMDGTGLAKRDFPMQCWIDAIPQLPADGKNACVRSVPYVWIEKTNVANPSAQCTGLGPGFLARPCEEPHAQACSASADPRVCIAGVPQDNCGLDLVTVLHGSYPDRTRWCAYWIPAATLPGDYAFCVAGVTGKNVMQANGAVGADGDLGIEVDPGPPRGWLGLADLATRYLECCGVSTRPVCEYPGP